MADEQDTWLNRATAERLLRGESLEAVDDSARDQAERLAEALAALSVGAAPATAELPGEEGALAAFRKARESAGDEWTSVARQPGRFGRGSDAGLIRIGAGPRPSRVPAWAHPARFALAAALTAGMLGGVAVAAGTGVLSTPFDDHRPAPGASVSAAGTPVRPQGSPSTESLLGGETGAPSTGATSRGPVPPSPDPSGKPKDRGTGSRGTSGNGWSRALAFCRDIQDGKSLGTDRRRALEGLAGGAGRVNKFCKAVVGTGAAGQNGVSDDGKGDGNGQGGQNSGPGGSGSGSGSGQGGDDDGQPGRGGSGGRDHGRGHHRQDGVVAPSPTAFARLLPNRPGSSPDPTYSAL
ncbi:hypothetical protein ABT075_04350 [Streptomyces sp. NPDC002677]|uniref:hypothetical protein n=1 Tax=Streptomyces sp. NPDC002677 TaxID=3154774 RepID=UPI00332C7FAE